MAEIAPLNLPVHLSPEEDIEIINELIDELADEFEETIEDAYPNGSVPLAYQLPAKQRLLAYMQVTAPEDWPMLQDKDVLEKQKAGVYPPFQSWYWSGIAALPNDFADDRKDFLDLYRRLIVRGE